MDFRLLVFLVVIGVASAFLATYENCSENCNINVLRIEPCKSKKACLFTTGENASMSFDFTPDFSASQLLTAVYWDQQNIMFADMGIVDACLHTTCPAEAGKEQTFNYVLELGKKLPKGSYKFRWQVWNKDNEAEVCCFKTNIKLREGKK